MDVLSDVIAIVRTGRPRSARLRWHAPWGQSFPAALGSAGFQVVLQGTCWLIPTGGAPPVALGVGDVVFFPHGHGYGLADSPTTPLAPPACDPYGDAALHASASTGHPAGDLAAVTLCGGYRLDRTRSHPLLGDLPDMVRLPARLGDRTELHAAVELLAAELNRPRLGANTLVPSLLDMLLLYILRAWFDDHPQDGTGTGWAAALADPAIATALQDIHHDLAHPWTVASLAASAGLSRAAFAKRFTTMTGQPPLSYLTWWRMTVAAQLLRTSDAPLHQVAAQTGYSSESAFANAFKRKYAIAPGRYRRHHGPARATTPPHQS
ncbi:AraC family transcriptional regulator [Actinomadura sp. LOL_016]|uniref:AraC family transcriptional regulator n=1 Tax=unclassified Actinomadura TaxID=2626254 RepID=UPI003A808B25